MGSTAGASPRELSQLSHWCEEKGNTTLPPGVGLFFLISFNTQLAAWGVRCALGSYCQRPIITVCQKQHHSLGARLLCEFWQLGPRGNEDHTVSSGCASSGVLGIHSVFCHKTLPCLPLQLHQGTGQPLHSSCHSCCISSWVPVVLPVHLILFTLSCQLIFLLTLFMNLIITCWCTF